MSSPATWATLDGKPTVFPPAAHTHSAADVTTGVLALARLPALPVSQVSGLQAALDGKLSAPTGTPGQYLRGDGTLASFPTTLAPSAHTHNATDITAGTLATARLPALSIAQTAGLQTALDGKLNVPAGTTAQYLRGDGSLATLPVQRRIETFTGTTNAQGQITVTYSSPYPTVPVVQTPVVSQPNQVWWVTNSTVSGFTMTLSERRTVSLLGAEVLLGAVVPVPGVTAKVLVVAD